MLLVADKNESVVGYVLADTTQPIAVFRYDLSPAEKAAHPSADALTRVFTLELDDHTLEPGAVYLADLPPARIFDGLCPVEGASATAQMFNTSRCAPR